ncbi:hypothetical protein BGZ93_007272 [Podila epicladia]|nr:hypothetical protein BGZ92_007836 [Podila epicladia]KAG0099514.1 hypothetical protein BGZ93_007272 [Podila epicladia]
MALRSITPSIPQLRLFIVVAIAIYLFTYLFNITDWTPTHNDCIFEYSSKTVEHRSSRLEYRFTNPSAQPVPEKQNVLVLTLVRDRKSWGQGRKVSDFMNIVQGFDYPMANMNIGILASDKKEFNAIVNYIKQMSGDMTNFFPQIRVILREMDTGSISREERKADNAQRDRRRLIARLRNYLLYSTLRDEDSVLWIDSDMVMVPNKLLQRMIDSGKDVLTTATRYGPNGPFIDLNAWVGERIKPNADQQAVIEKGGIFVPQPKSVKYTHELDEEFGELDSVGGTVLFVRSEVHREGAAFTTNYVIGAGWKYEGYDGIESEGLCYVAGFLGYKCWGMPYDIAEHSED